LIATAAKDSGEALAALVVAAGNNPTPHAFVTALRDVPEAINVFQSILPLIDQLAAASRSRHPP
jgi:hypothetical protein